MGRRLAGLFHGRPRLQVGSLLAGPMGWLVIGYLGSLAVLFAASFWTVNAETGLYNQTFSVANFKELANTPVYGDVAWRTSVRPCPCRGCPRHGAIVPDVVRPARSGRG